MEVNCKCADRQGIEVALEGKRSDHESHPGASAGNLSFFYRVTAVRSPEGKWAEAAEVPEGFLLRFQTKQPESGWLATAGPQLQLGQILINASRMEQSSGPKNLRL